MQPSRHSLAMPQLRKSQSVLEMQQVYKNFSGAVDSEASASRPISLPRDIQLHTVVKTFDLPADKLPATGTIEALGPWENSTNYDEQVVDIPMEPIHRHVHRGTAASDTQLVPSSSLQDDANTSSNSLYSRFFGGSSNFQNAQSERSRRREAGGFSVSGAVQRIRDAIPSFHRGGRDLLLLGYSVLFFIICTYIVCIANSYADRVNTNGKLPDSLRYVSPDLLIPSGRQWFREIGMPHDIADIMVQIAVAGIFLRAFTCGQWSVTVTRRCFWLVGILYLLRAVFIFSTVLPSPWTDCEYSYVSNMFYDAVLLLGQKRVACGDVFYSGHTLLFCALAMVWWTYPVQCSGGANCNNSNGWRKVTTKTFLLPREDCSYWCYHPMDDSEIDTRPSRRPTQDTIAEDVIQPQPYSTSFRIRPQTKNLIKLSFMITITLYAIFGMYALIASAYHYTIDVLAALIFSFSTWLTFHLLIRVPQLRDTKVGRFVQYFDDPHYGKRIDVEHLR